MVSLQPQEWSTQADPATGEEMHGALGWITGSMRRELRNGLRAVLPPNGRHFFFGRCSQRPSQLPNLEYELTHRP